MIGRRILLGATAAAALACASPLTARGSARPPSILFILIDDMGYGDLSVTGNRPGATPNIDLLAAEGLLMTQFYDAAPICSPSRAGAFTGRFPARDGFVSFIGSRAQNAAAAQADWLDPALPNLASMLKQHGYATGHFGKWHMGGGRDIGDAPVITRYGFDESYTQFEGLGPRVVPSNVDGEMERLARQSEALGSGPVDRLRRGEITARYVDKAIDFVARHRGVPWFIQLWPDDVHAPWLPDEGQRSATARAGRDRNDADFQAVLTAMDAQIGRLVEALRVQGQLDDTLILLTSDNGPNSVPRFYGDGATPPGSAGIFRGRKDSLYEGGIRQPLIIRWPTRVPAGKRDATTVAHAVDLLPTLAAAAGVARPAGIDGIDLSRAWRGVPIVRRPDLFWTYGAFGRYDASPRPALKRDNSPGFAIRSGRWKLLADSNGINTELYDVVADPAETRNVAASNPTTVGSLKYRLNAWERSLNRPKI